MARFIPFEGIARDMQPKDPVNGFTCRELYAILDCQIVETFPITVGEFAGKVMILDEEGKCRADCSLRANHDATVILRQQGCIPGDWVTGNVILCNEQEFQ